MPAAGRLRDMGGDAFVDDAVEIEENIVYVESGTLEVNHYLRDDAIKPGVIYLFWSDGKISFDLPDAQATEGTLANANGSSLTVNPSQAYSRFISGDQVTIGARTLGGLTQGGTFYVELGNTGNNEMFLHRTRAEALLGRSNTRVSSNNNGLISGTPPTVNLAAGRRNQTKFGSNDQAPIFFVEADSAGFYGADNYNSSTSKSRFQSGGITLENFVWKSLVPGQDRSDFDVAPDAAPTLINCRFECFQQYSHFGSPNMTIRGLTFDSNFYSANEGQRVLDIAAKIPVPDGFVLQPTGNDLRVLGVFLEDADGTLNNFLRLEDISGIRNIEISTFNPNGNDLSETQIALKGIILVDPAGVIGRTNGNGAQFIFRSIKFDTGAEAIDSMTRTDVTPTEAGNPDPAVKTKRGTDSLAFEVLSHAAVSVQGYSEYDSYEVIHTSAVYRKAQKTFTIDKAPAVAGTVQTIGLELFREVYPNNVNFALSETAPTEATTLEHVYELFKRWEVENPTVFSRTESVATIFEGYIRFADNINVVLDTQATQAFAFDADTSTATFKIGSTLTTGSNDLLGIEVAGTGTIAAGENQTLPTTVLFKTSSGGNARLSLTGLDREAKTALFRADGALVGSVITGTTTASIDATQDEASAGMVLASYRRGYIQQLLPLDLSQGGAFARNLEPMLPITDWDNRNVFYSDRVSTVSDFVFGQETVTRNGAQITRPTCLIRVGQEQWNLRSLSSSYFQALWTEEGLRYLSRFGQQLDFFSYTSYLGSEFRAPPGTRIIRRNTGDTSATILSTIYVAEGEDLFASEEANRQVQLNGIKNASEFASAIWDGRVDIANASSGSALESLKVVKAVLAGEADVNGSTWSFKDDAGNDALTIGVDPNGSRTLP